MKFGFSTGAIALGDFERGLELCREHAFEAVEISALREHELPALLAAFGDLDLRGFKAVSFHAPSQRHDLSEKQLLNALLKIAERGFPIVVHPDIIDDIKAWSVLGSSLCLENMDKRKPIGRNVAELSPFFDILSEAKLCVDLAHARQVDPSMTVAAEILSTYKHRVTHLHVSDLTSSSTHEPLSLAAVQAFSTIAPLVPCSTVVILESTFCSEDVCLLSEVEAAQTIFADCMAATR